MRLILGLCAIFFAGCLQLNVTERQFFLPDNRVTPAVLAQSFPDYSMKSLALTGHDGTTLYGEAFVTDKAKITIMYWGGNQFRIRDGAGPIVNAYLKHPINLVLIDHRGYGGSEGRPTLNDLQKDGVAVYQQVKSLFANTPLVVNGYSLGSFTAAYVAHELSVDGVILEASAPSALDWASAQVPWFAKPFVSINVEDSLLAVDNKTAMSKQNGSVMILVGDNDAFTPASLSDELYQALTKARYKSFVLAQKAGHGQAKLGPEFESAMPSFIQSLAAPTSAKATP